MSGFKQTTIPVLLNNLSNTVTCIILVYPYMTHFKLGSHIERKLATVKGNLKQFMNNTLGSLQKLIQH